MRTSLDANTLLQGKPGLQIGYLSSIKISGEPTRPLSREDNGYGCACDSCGGWNNIHNKDRFFSPGLGN